MTDAAVLVARPASADRLVLLFHGVGAAASGLVPLGQARARGVSFARTAPAWPWTH